MSFNIKELRDAIDNPYVNIAADGIIAGDVAGYIDTGSYMLNAHLSGSIYGGFASNKIIGIAGQPATGKTFFALSAVKTFLDSNPENVVAYFESESAISKQMLVERKIDVSRVIFIPVNTIQEFRTNLLHLMEQYTGIAGLDDKAKRKHDIPKFVRENRPQMLVVLDSLGNLSSTKEMEDTAAGKETADMTKGRLIKATFRVVTLTLGLANVPMILTAHTYKEQGSMYPQDLVAGGNGMQYAASTILFLSKAKDKAGTDVIGNVITAKLFKSRLTKENSVSKHLLRFESGLHKYYGLLDLGLKYDIFKKTGNKFDLEQGKFFESEIYNDPERFFTPKIMKALDEAAHKEYTYGSNELIPTPEENETTETVEVTNE